MADRGSHEVGHGLQLPRRVAQHLFVALARTDATEKDRKPFRAGIGVDFDPIAQTVRPELEVRRLAARDGGATQRLELGALQLRKRFPDRRADEFGRSATVVALRVRVETGEAPLSVERDERIADAVEDRRVVTVCLAGLVLGELATHHLALHLTQPNFGVAPRTTHRFAERDDQNDRHRIRREARRDPRIEVELAARIDEQPIADHVADQRDHRRGQITAAPDRHRSGAVQGRERHVGAEPRIEQPAQHDCTRERRDRYAIAVPKSIRHANPRRSRPR